MPRPPRQVVAAGGGTLVLTHYIPGLASGADDEWSSLASEHFAGRIVLGDDLTTGEF